MRHFQLREAEQVEQSVAALHAWQRKKQLQSDADYLRRIQLARVAQLVRPQTVAHGSRW